MAQQGIVKNGVAITSGAYNTSDFKNAPPGSYEAQLYAAMNPAAAPVQQNNSPVAPNTTSTTRVSTDGNQSVSSFQDSKNTPGSYQYDTSKGLAPGTSSQPGFKPLSNNGSDSTFSQAMNSQNPGAVPTADDFYEKIFGMLSPVISAISLKEQAAEGAANLDSTRKTSASNASLGARGLAGSTEGNSMANEVENERQQAIVQAKSDQASAIGDLVKWAVPESFSLYQTALTRNDGLSAQYVKDKQALAEKTVAGVAAQGVPLDQFMKDNPEEYSQLLQYYSGSESHLKADYLANIPAPSLLNNGQPVSKQGNQATFMYLDPITKEYKTMTLDVPGGFSGDYDAKTVPGAGVVVYDKTTGAAQVIGGTQNPYYAANQQATLDSKRAMITSRYGTTVNNITKQLFPTPTSNPLNLYSNSLNYTTKLNTAYTQSKASTGDKGPADLELIDAAVKINNGGQQITETQINSLFKSLSIQGKATIEGGKLTGISALLTDGQRDAIHELANENVKAQRDNAVEATKVIADRAVRAGVPIENLSTPEDILSLSAAADTTGGSSNIDLSSVGAVDNGDGTFTGPDGQLYDITE